MFQFFVKPTQININDKSVIIEGPDVNHIKNVLRMKEGEEIAVSNGVDGKEYRCGIVALEEHVVRCEIYFVKEDNVELPAQIYLFQGLPKSDKMELIIQKAVELGVYQIIPVATKRCVVKLDDKKAASKIARWQSIAEAAAKQSKRGIIPKVHDVVTFSQAIAIAREMEGKLIPYEMAEDMERTRTLLSDIKSGDRVAVFIGPEGGFEQAEIDSASKAGVNPITLGRRILRTETAGMTVLSWLGYLLEK